MDGLEKVSGADTSIELNGVKYQTSRLTYKHIAEASQYVLDKRPNLVSEVAAAYANIPEEHRKDFLEAAMTAMEQRKPVTKDELQAFMVSMQGQHFVLWQMLRDKNPKFTSPESVYEEFKELDLEELARKINSAAGLDDLKNSDGPARKRPGKVKKDQHEQRGLSSISA